MSNYTFKKLFHCFITFFRFTVFHRLYCIFSMWFLLNNTFLSTFSLPLNHIVHKNGAQMCPHYVVSETVVYLRSTQHGLPLTLWLRPCLYSSDMMDLMCPLWMMLRASGLSIKMQCRTSRMPAQPQIHQLVNSRRRERHTRGHSSKDIQSSQINSECCWSIFYHTFRK